METAPLKSFATWARTELITQVSARITALLAPASPERTENSHAVHALEADVKKAGGDSKGKDAVADKVAYTWFNRIIALRFMDANGYTSSGVVSPAAGQSDGQPEILADAKRGTLDPDVINIKTATTVTRLLDGTLSSTDPQGEAYALLLAEYCRYWNRSMPFMFEREGDYTELLIPANLLADESILARAAITMTSEVCQDVEVIGWLYQFYISERKDEVFAGFKKNRKAGAAEIPVATQLFTPHWIVRYLVENSVGRMWMLNHPDSCLVKQMDYYIAPVDEETDFLKLSGPEELTVIDPACGSGHMLTYAFDLLYAIYEEEGYAPAEIPSLILTRNLYGTEIDPRAGALAAFALTMKARARQRTYLTHSSDDLRRRQPNICVIEPISFRPDELDLLLPLNGDRDLAAAFWNQFKHADTFGSLIRSDAGLTTRFADYLATLDGVGDLLRANTTDRAMRVVYQSEYLARQYAVAIANPPYMGSKQMNALLSQFMKDEYPDSKADLFAAFIERCLNLAGPRGTVAMITMQSWMFLSSYEKLRASLLTKQRITSMLHLGARAFDSIGGEVVSSTAFTVVNVPPEARYAARKRAGTFIRLVEGHSEAEKMNALKTALEIRTKDVDLHLASDADFAAVPGSPIVYWLSEKMRAAFTHHPSLGASYEAMNGMTTGENATFLRQWHEVSKSRTCRLARSPRDSLAGGARWFPYNKGGEFRKWYGNQEYVINWENDGRDVIDNGRAFTRGRKYYFRPMVSWAKVSSGQPAFRYYPDGFLFDVAGTAMFGRSVQALSEAIALCNASTSEAILAALSPTMNFESGQISRLPLANAAKSSVGLSERVDELIASSKHDWDQSETSWDFAVNPLVNLIRSVL